MRSCGGERERVFEAEIFLVAARVAARGGYMYLVYSWTARHHRVSTLRPRRALSHKVNPSRKKPGVTSPLSEPNVHRPDVKVRYHALHSLNPLAAHDQPQSSPFMSPDPSLQKAETTSTSTSNICFSKRCNHDIWFPPTPATCSQRSLQPHMHRDPDPRAAIFSVPISCSTGIRSVITALALLFSCQIWRARYSSPHARSQNPRLGINCKRTCVVIAMSHSRALVHKTDPTIVCFCGSLKHVLELACRRHNLSSVSETFLGGQRTAFDVAIDSKAGCRLFSLLFRLGLLREGRKAQVR